VVARVISLDVDGMPMNACLSVPEGSGPHPGLLVAHNQEGLGVFTHDLVEKLAAAGYVAICPDHYHECAPNADLATRRAALRDTKILRDLAVTLDILRARPDVQRDNVAVIGHCMGGRAAFMAAEAFPELKAAVAFYSSGMFMSRGNDMPTPFELLDKVTCPVIGFFGGKDPLIPLDQVDKIEAALKRFGVPHEFHRYLEAGHAFASFDSPAAYHAEATADSWGRTIEFLAKHLNRQKTPAAATA
jgi:carboxymethylenebutenolidase